MAERSRVVPLLLALGLLAGCGSTVASTGASGAASAYGGGPATAGAPTGDGLSGAGGEGALAVPGALGQDGTAAVPGGIAGRAAPVGSTGGPGAGGGTAGVTSGAAPVAVSLVGPGVTAKEIRIGLPYTANAQEAAAALGAGGEGAGGGDGRRIWEIVVSSVNASGGVLGRRLVPVWHVFDSTSSEPQASKEQSACARWTQDEKVFWAAVFGGETITPCLHKAGVAQSSSSLTDASSAFYRAHPYYVEAGMLQMDRVAAALPATLQSQGYFSPWDTVRGAPGGAQPVKVGIVAFDDARTKNAVRSILVPAVKKVVGSDPEVVEIAYPQSSADNATSISAIQAATLRFRDAGVTHVLPFETIGAGVGTFFAQGAEQQKYYPRYGLTSGNGAQLLVDQKLWPPSTLNGALGFGWLPLVDLTNADNPDDGPFSNAARRSCLALMVKGGIDVSAAIVKRQAIESCNTVRLLKAALEKGGGAVHRDAFVAGVHALGTSFESGLTFGTRYDRAHHDGVALVRPFGFTSACGCFRYTGAATPVS